MTGDRIRGKFRFDEEQAVVGAKCLQASALKQRNIARSFALLGLVRTDRLMHHRALLHLLKQGADRRVRVTQLSKSCFLALGILWAAQPAVGLSQTIVRDFVLRIEAHRFP